MIIFRKQTATDAAVIVLNAIEPRVALLSELTGILVLT